MEKSVNEKVFELYDEGIKPGKIAQKLRIKKTVVEDILGDLAESKGLGDVVESITEATGIKAVVDAVSKAVGVEDCGCAARKETLNKAFPNRRLEDLSNEDFEILKGIVDAKYTSVNRPLQVKIVDVYNRVFKSKREVSSCGTCVAKMIKELTRLYNAAK
jgi:hypothetical protein